MKTHSRCAAALKIRGKMNGRYLDYNSRNFFTYLLNLCCGAIGWNWPGRAVRSTAAYLPVWATGVEGSSVERQQHAQFRTFAAGCLIFRKILYPVIANGAPERPLFNECPLDQAVTAPEKVIANICAAIVCPMVRTDDVWYSRGVDGLSLLMPNLIVEGL